MGEEPSSDAIVQFGHTQEGPFSRLMIAVGR